MDKLARFDSPALHAAGVIPGGSKLRCQLVYEGVMDTTSVVRMLHLKKDAGNVVPDNLTSGGPPFQHELVHSGSMIKCVYSISFFVPWTVFVVQ